MALTDEGSNGFVMPVTPYGGAGGGDFLGGANGSWLILFLLIMMCGGGWGNGFGGFAGNNFAADSAVLYPWMNQSNQIHDGFRDQMINGTVTGIRDAVSTGFGDTALGLAGINQNICQTGAGVTNALNAGFNGVNAGMNAGLNAVTAGMNNGFSSAEIAANSRQMASMQADYANQIANLERSFASQTATAAQLNGIQSQLATCCCDNRAAVADLKYTVASEACADRAAVENALRDVLTAQTAGIQSIKDQLCQDKIDAKNERIQELQAQLNLANLQASQTAQTARILADNAAQTQAIENYVRPQVNPCYTVPNPYACYSNTPNCGCGLNG